MRFLLSSLLVLLVLCTSPAFSQSGRTRKTNTVAKPQATPQPQGTDENEGITERRTAGEGETVEGDVIRFDTSLVTVPVSVVDRSGRYVPSLRRSDFHIFENGIEQKIAYFATTDQPFTVVLMLDTSGSTEFRLEDIQDAAINFVSKLKPEDVVMVLSFDDRIDVLTKPTTNRDVISKAIRNSRTGGSTRLYDAVDAVLNKHLASISGRKAIVLFTDGVDTASYRASYDSTLRDAEEADAPIYTVDYDTRGANGVLGQGLPIPGGRGGVILGWPFPRTGGGGTSGPNQGDYRRANNYLHALSNNTGGRFYSADSLFGIGQAFAWIAEELGRQYSLGYYPQLTGKAGERRQLKVKVDEPQFVVKARDSYIYTDRKPNQAGEKKPYASGQF